jgi:hypothetical protein
MGDEAEGKPARVFQCSACKEYINTSMRECRFCGSPVDYKTALAGLSAKKRVDAACDYADTIHAMMWSFVPVSWALGVGLYVIMGGGFPLIPAGLTFFPSFVLAGALMWRLMFWEIHSEEPRFEKAKRRVKLSLWVCLPSCAVSLIIIIMLALGGPGR